MEKDEEAAKDPLNKDIPQKLIFLHQRNTLLLNYREWPYYDCMIVSTSGDGINCENMIYAKHCVICKNIYNRDLSFSLD